MNRALLSSLLVAAMALGHGLLAAQAQDVQATANPELVGIVAPRLRGAVNIRVTVRLREKAQQVQRELAHARRIACTAALKLR